MLGTIPDLLLVIFGFGFIVFVHELGHFLAARWAGIRVLAFAIGFGPAVVSFRSGLGLRRGSSEAEYLESRRRDTTVSPTEYRLNVLPFGGYVKMLGQEDANPEAVSDEPDSYQRCKPWKRLIVISAGVVMNVIAAAVLFIIVFLAGMRVEPARVGAVAAGSPAATCVAVNARDLGINEPGLEPGDTILAINGERPRSFNDLVLATAMAQRDTPLDLTVSRPGVPSPMMFVMRPRVGASSGLLEIGVEPSRSGKMLNLTDASQAKDFAKFMQTFGLADVPPGSVLESVEGTAAADANALFAAVRHSQGRAVPVMFRSPDGAQHTVSVVPRPQMQLDHVPRANNVVAPVEHLLGLMPVMVVGRAEAAAIKQGLRDGDMFARIGNTEYPAVAQGIAEIKASAGRTIPVVVLRKDPETGVVSEVTLPRVEVSSKGQIGFGVGDSGSSSSIVALPFPVLLSGTSESARTNAESTSGFTPAATTIITAPGTRLVSIDGTAVSNFADIRSALRRATVRAVEANAHSAEVTVRVQLPKAGVPSDAAPIETLTWNLGASDLRDLHALGWESPVPADLFEPEQTLLKASSVPEALTMGVAETRRVMLTTYVTFLRLAEGSVKIEHLKGPVGIAHLGTMVASRGFIWLLFFLALISMNLAVINFLPLPIVDGGQFLFILFELVRGRPVPLAVQSAATLAGLVLIGCVFLIVTYNDIKNLLGL